MSLLLRIVALAVAGFPALPLNLHAAFHFGVRAADDANHWLISLPEPLPILDYSLLQHSAISWYLVVLVKSLCHPTGHDIPSNSPVPASSSTV